MNTCGESPHNNGLYTEPRVARVSCLVVRRGPVNPDVIWLSMDDENPYQAPAASEEHQADPSASADLFVPTGTATGTTICCLFWLGFAPVLNRLTPWGEGFIPASLILNRNDGLFIYGVKSVVASLVAGLLGFMIHRSCLSLATKWRLNKLPIGFIVPFCGAIAYCVFKLLVK